MMEALALLVDNAGGRPGGALTNIRLDTTAAARPRGARCHETHTPQVKLHDTVLLHSTSTASTAGSGCSLSLSIGQESLLV